VRRQLGARPRGKAHPHTGGPLDRSPVSKRFKSALKRAGVREVRFHDLRHTFGTRCAANGVAMRTIQEWMGHRDIKTTQIYADYAPDANEVDLINAAFAALLRRQRPMPAVARQPKSAARATTRAGGRWRCADCRGHPLHPPFTDAAIGMFVVAAGLAVIAAGGAINEPAGKGMWLALIGGLIAALGAD
jgi:integrase-like protein